MSDLEFQVMDEVYFLCSFSQLLSDLGCNEELLNDTLIELLRKDFIQQLEYSEEEGDYIKLDTPDFSKVKACSYVATKKGLLEHNAK